MKSYMKKIVFLILVISIFGITGCSNNKAVTDEKTASVTPSKTTEETKVDDSEIRKIAEDVYTKLVEAIRRAGEKNNWGYQSKPDPTILEKEINSYATTSLINTIIKPNKDNLYCECDIQVLPSPEFNSRFIITENAPDRFTIYTIQPMDEIGNSGKHIYFTFIKENDQWKIDQIKMESHFTTPLNLTWEEVKPFLEELYEQEIELTGEKMVENVVAYDDENKEISEPVKTYLFTVKNDSVVKGIFSNSGRIIYDVSSLESSNKTTNTKTPEQTIQESKETSDITIGKGNNTENLSNHNASSKAEFLAKLDEIINQEKHSESGVTADLTDDNAHNQNLWDDALNEIYGVLKTQLSESEMNDLRTKQRQWIVDRDAAAQKRYDEEGGGSYSRVVYGETLVQVTKERCYELVNLYMK